METRTSSQSLPTVSTLAFGAGAPIAPISASVETAPVARTAESEQPAVVVELSAAAQSAMTPVENPRAVAAAARTTAADGEPARREAPATEAPSLSSVIAAAQTHQVARLRSREFEIRSTEYAQAAAAGGHGGVPTFVYQTGPDGRRYAVGGSIAYDTSPAATPEASISKAQRVRAAAMGGNASADDRAAAAAATRMEADARAEIAAQRLAEITQRSGAAEPSLPKVELVVAEAPAERPEDRNLKPLRLFTREPLALGLPEVELQVQASAADVEEELISEPFAPTPASNDDAAPSREVVA